MNETAERDVQASLLQARWAETNQIDGVRYQQIACVAADAAYSVWVRLRSRQAHEADTALHLKRGEALDLAHDALQLAFGHYRAEREG